MHYRFLIWQIFESRIDRYSVPAVVTEVPVRTAAVGHVESPQTYTRLVPVVPLHISYSRRTEGIAIGRHVGT